MSSVYSLPIPKRLFRFCTFSIPVIASLILEGCGLFPESSFSLANESRLPKWLSLPPNQERSSVTVTMDYYIDLVEPPFSLCEPEVEPLSQR